MAGRVNLTKKVMVEGKGLRFCPAVWADNGRPKPDMVLVDGIETRAKEGQYYIEWRENGQRQRKAVGAEAVTALMHYRTKEAYLLGLEKTPTPQASPSGPIPVQEKSVLAPQASTRLHFRSARNKVFFVFVISKVFCIGFRPRDNSSRIQK
jgi:hypothetical protein